MKRGLFAGTFDPPTVGHLDIIRRAASFCETLYIGLADNPSKTPPMFSLKQRKELLQEALQGIPNIKIISFKGLVVDFAKKQKIDVLIRALRPGSDLSNEFAMAAANRHMGGLETLFLTSDPRYSQISSSLVREIISAGGNPKDFI